MLEDLARGQRNADRLGGRRQLDRHDRVAAQGEERLGDRHLVKAEQAADDVGERTLGFGGQGDELLLQCLAGLRQRVTVEFARRGERRSGTAISCDGTMCLGGRWAASSVIAAMSRSSASIPGSATR